MTGYQVSPQLRAWADEHPDDQAFPNGEAKALIGYVEALVGPDGSERGRLLLMAAETTARWADANARQVAAIDRVMTISSGLKREKADADQLVAEASNRFHEVGEMLSDVLGGSYEGAWSDEQLEAMSALAQRLQVVLLGG